MLARFLLTARGRRMRGRPGQSQTLKRLLQPRSSKISADPSGTNLITRRPFSYKVEVTSAYNSTTLKSNYAVVFPDLVVAKILGVRIDRVSVWGGVLDGAQPNVYLGVGDFYAARDIGGANARARLNCLPRLISGQCDEDTLISYEGASHLHIQGVVYIRREEFPGKPAFDSRTNGLGVLPPGPTGSSSTPGSTVSSESTTATRPSQPPGSQDGGVIPCDTPACRHHNC